MNGELPLHPAIVHLPIGLALIMPFLAAGIYFMVKTGRLAAGAWIIPVVLQVLVVAASFAAMQTGEHEEDQVEKVVAEEFIETHEDAAKLFMFSAVLSLLVTAAGYFDLSLQNVIRMAAVAVLFVSAAAVLYAGKLGGELVYKHGAASAYGNVDQIMPVKKASGHDEEEDDD